MKKIIKTIVQSLIKLKWFITFIFSLISYILINYKTIKENKSELIEDMTPMFLDIKIAIFNSFNVYTMVISILIGVAVYLIITNIQLNNKINILSDVINEHGKFIQEVNDDYIPYTSYNRPENTYSPVYCENQNVPILDNKTISRKGFLKYLTIKESYNSIFKIKYLGSGKRLKNTPLSNFAKSIKKSINESNRDNK